MAQVCGVSLLLGVCVWSPAEEVTLAVQTIAVSFSWSPGKKETLEMGLWFCLEGMGVAGEINKKENLVWK